VVISYHSGEDRIVKERFRRADDGGCTCPPNLPCGCGAVPVARLLKRGGWVPDAAEIAANPRASSARLRAVEKLP
jgi:16S rRNA (cytosine1402-N4)-methyltransferase